MFIFDRPQKTNMENSIETTEELQQHPALIVTEEMRSYIYEIAKWTRFLAIVGFVITGFIVIAAFTANAIIATNPLLSLMFSQAGAAGSIALTIVFLIYAFILFYPSLLMFKYSTKAKQGVLYGEQASLNEAFSKLKSLFKYWGILMIVFIALNLLTVISTIVGGAAVR